MARERMRRPSQRTGFTRPPCFRRGTIIRSLDARIKRAVRFTPGSSTGPSPRRVQVLFVVLAHERRRIVHCNVTDAPRALWTGQQVINAFPDETAPRYLHRDRDAIYGSDFISRVRSMGIEQVVSAARSPWQNPYVERVIGSLRREGTGPVLLMGASPPRPVLPE